MTELPDRLTAALSNRYALEGELGAGGMATVYAAQDLKHNRQVAVKVLHPELAAIIGAERFLKEIEVTANLQRPHILPLFDSGNYDVHPDGQRFVMIKPFQSNETHMVIVLNWFEELRRLTEDER